MRWLHNARLSIFSCLICVNWPAASQSAASFLKNETGDAYWLVKRLLSQEYNSSKANKSNNTSSHKIELRSCMAGSFYAGIKGPLKTALYNLADFVIAEHLALRFYRFPPSTWQDLLEQLERDQVNYITQNANNLDDEITWKRLRNLENKFESDVNSNIAKLGLKLPKIVTPECGGGQDEFIIDTDPPNGRVYLIPRLYYKFCESKNFDPTDLSKCDLWYPPVRSGERAFLSGTYKYFIKWGQRISEVGEKDSDRYYKFERIVFD